MTTDGPIKPLPGQLRLQRRKGSRTAISNGQVPAHGRGGFVLYSVGFNRADDGGQPSGRERHWEGLLYPKPDLDQNDWVWNCPAVVSGTKP